MSSVFYWSYLNRINCAIEIKLMDWSPLNLFDFFLKGSWRSINQRNQHEKSTSVAAFIFRIRARIRPSYLQSSSCNLFSTIYVRKVNESEKTGTHEMMKYFNAFTVRVATATTQATTEKCCTITEQLIWPLKMSLEAIKNIKKIPSWEFKLTLALLLLCCTCYVDCCLNLHSMAVLHTYTSILA